MRSPFVRGMAHGVPIMLGYLSVSFGFGILAVRLGLPVLGAVAISATNLTSAGQAAGVEIIAAGGTLLEMALTQLVINLRYALMGFSLSQKLDETFTTPHRLLVSFGITDEIYAVAISQPERLTATYMLGLILTPMLGWITGHGAGRRRRPAAAGCGIRCHGHCAVRDVPAIIVPPSRKDKRVLLVVLLAAAVSCLFRYLLPAVSAALRLIVSALAASVAGALLCPVSEEAAA